MSGFQSVINNQPAPGIEGDWASANARFTALAGAGDFVAGPAGVTVGRFAWADGFGVVRNGGGMGKLIFVHRDNLALITAWLASSTMLVPPGLEITGYDSGDVWVRFAGGAQIGQKVYANYADGSAYAAATGTPPAAGSATGSIAAGSASVTGYISPANPVNGAVAGGILTVTAVTSGTIVVGGLLAGTGVSSGQTVLAQLTGTAGGVGTYEVSISQTVASGALTQSYGTFTAASALSGAFAVGDILSGSGVTAGTQITALGTGVGGLGTYIVNLTQTASSTTISAAGGVETRWIVDSFAAAGELAKISTHG